MTPSNLSDPALKAAVESILDELERAKADEAAANRLARDQVVEDQKKVSYYEVLVNAFINTAMELDKSLLTLASGAIAFSLTLAAPSKSSTLSEVAVYFLANLMFLVTIFCTLLAFALNKTYISDLINKRPNTGRALKLVDRTAMLCFALGVLLLTIVGGWATVQKLEIFK